MTLKDRFNQFVDNTNGQFIEVSYKEAIYQCMDLAYLWVFCLGYPKATIQHLYAYQVFTEPNDLTRQYFDIIPNTPDGIPQDGDLVVLKGGTAGHIVIALGGGTTNTFKDFEQNNPLGTNAHIQSRNYTNVLGWLRPKYQQITLEQDIISRLTNEAFNALPTDDPLKQGNLEGYVRQIIEEHKRYKEVIANEDKVKDLEDKIESLNETLAEKSLELNDVSAKLEAADRDNKDLNQQLLEARSERDSADGEKKIANGKVETLSKRVTTLEEDNEGLKEALAKPQSDIIKRLSLWEIVKIKFFGGGEEK